MGIGILSIYLPPAEVTKTVETSNYYQLRCPAETGSFFPAAPIRVWRFNTFWFKSLTAKQEADYNYWPLTAHLYLIPENQIRVYRINYTCWGDEIPPDYDLIFFQHLYLLKGSSIEFLLLVNSTSSFENGHFNITICDNVQSFNNQPPSCSVNFHFMVQPNDKEVPMNVTFVASEDSYYYVKTTSPTNAVISSYQVTMEVLFLNSSDWNGIKEATEFSPASVSQSIYSGDGLSSIFGAKEYTVVASFPTKYDQANMGEMKFNKYHQNLVYAVPAIAAGLFMLLGIISIACLCICCHVVRRIIRYRQKGEELSILIND